VYVSGMGMISCSMFLEQFEGMTIGFDWVGFEKPSSWL
jgi:hypothetical protein